MIPFLLSALNNIAAKPGLRLWDSNFPQWVKQLECIVDKGINRITNRAGFARSGIEPINSDLILKPLPVKCPSFINNTVRKRNIFNISNEVISDSEFLSKWEEDLKKKRN